MRSGRPQPSLICGAGVRRACPMTTPMPDEVELMIVLRFRVVCQPDKTDQMMVALREVIAPSRAVEGVVSLDIARDLTDPNAFIATEVFQDEAARERQESLSQVEAVMSLLPSSIISPPEATVYLASEAVPAM